MKNLILILLFTTAICTGQAKWRTLTVSSMSGVTFSGDYLQTVSMSIDYEIKNQWAISSWSGVNYNKSYNGGWISTSVMIGKKFHGFNINGGLMYGTGNVNTPLPDQIISRDFAAVIVISKRFKL